MVSVTKLLGADPFKDADEALGAIALLVGTYGGRYQMPCPAPISDNALREMVTILGPAHVKVRRGALVREDNLGVGDALVFEHIKPAVTIPVPT